MHGTAETPALFADLVCLASLSKPATVALELPSRMQADIDTFIGSDGGEAAIARFLQNPFWRRTFSDGRPFTEGKTSQAMFRLFERLRELRAAGKIRSVVAFEPPYKFGPTGFSNGDRENGMAAALLAQTRKAGLTLVLTGNAHARLMPRGSAGPPYVPMAAYLPAKSTVTLNVPLNGGASWICYDDKCGPSSAAPVETIPPRGIVFGDTPGKTYSGVANLGVATTASPPQPTP